jgi:hypothetical protein
MIEFLIKIIIFIKNYIRRYFNSINMGNKRKRENENFISGSMTRNYFLDNTLVDYISLYKIYDINDKPDKNRKEPIKDEFTNFIMEQGNKFEQNIYEDLKNNYECVQVAYSYNDRNIKLFEETKKHIKNGVPIIYQGVLYNFNNNTFGSPDLLIRSDFMKTIFNIDEISIPSSKFNIPYHYVVIDIKYSTIKLDCNGMYVLNDGNSSAYKGQILLYTIALSELLDIKINNAYILGKKYKWTKNGITNKYDYINDKMLGLIDFKNKDKDYYDKLENCLKWLNDLYNDGMNWKLLPKPSRKELYPNMCHKNDDTVSKKIKYQLANEIKELTSILNISFKNRNIAHENGIYRWDDPKCICSNLNIKGKTAEITDKILNINRGDIIFQPDKIKTNTINGHDWRYNNNMEFYIDYETLSNNLEVNSILQYSNVIFMIGIGYYDTEWKYKCFVLEDTSINAEKKMFNEFENYINDILLKYNKTDAVYYHWTSAEPIFYKNVVDKIPNLKNKNFIDLYKLFKEELIVIKDATDYSLKTIANAMYQHKLIDITWDKTLECCDGLNALHIAMNIYNNNQNITVKTKEMQDIIKYNEIDCHVLYKILNYLRLNH